MLVARRCHPLPLLVVSFLDVSGVFWCASCACKGFFSGKGTQEWVPKRPQFPLAYTTAHLWRQCLGSQRYLFIETGWDMRHCAKWMNTEIWSSKVFQTFQTAFKNSSDFHPWNAKCAKSHNSKTGSIDAWGIQVLAPALTLCHSSKIATGWPPVHLEVLERVWPVWPTNGVQVAVLCQLSRRHGLAANHKAMETMTTSSCSLRASQNGSENQLNQWLVDPSLIVRMWLCAIRCFLYSTFGCCWKHKIHIFPMFLLSGIWRDSVHIFRHTWVLGIFKSQGNHYATEMRTFSQNHIKHCRKHHGENDTKSDGKPGISR